MRATRHHRLCLRHLWNALNESPRHLSAQCPSNRFRRTSSNSSNSSNDPTPGVCALATPPSSSSRRTLRTRIILLSMCIYLQGTSNINSPTVSRKRALGFGECRRRLARHPTPSSSPQLCVCVCVVYNYRCPACSSRAQRQRRDYLLIVRPGAELD
ncbi:hypothetical protein TSAR_012549 [Trichomalopsis sarcophagae]|uniref:Uncharacterized protein n=1 Tax=Trichomalopsis sarcophagae TaxID=543379 RepID=A0A232FGT0_9HYME|nr:hypothetical protein TSAR_012549 [Trichomalopsis sarcophagae]